jgi:hypothetical protein
MDRQINAVVFGAVLLLYRALPQHCLADGMGQCAGQLVHLHLSLLLKLGRALSFTTVELVAARPFCWLPSPPPPRLLQHRCRGVQIAKAAQI